MRHENVKIVLEWLVAETLNTPPSGRWIKRSAVVEMCKDLDVPLSYLTAHGYVTVCKDACFLGRQLEVSHESESSGGSNMERKDMLSQYKEMDALAVELANRDVPDPEYAGPGWHERYDWHMENMMRLHALYVGMQEDES